VSLQSQENIISSSRTITVQFHSGDVAWLPGYAYTSSWSASIKLQPREPICFFFIIAR
jgi:hypothetical protein